MEWGPCQCRLRLIGDGANSRETDWVADATNRDEAASPLAAGDGPSFVSLWARARPRRPITMLALWVGEETEQMSELRALVESDAVLSMRSGETMTQYPEIGVGNGRSVRVHRIRAERALGHPLPKSVVVHHADGSKAADAPLVICQDIAYHRLLHTRMNLVRAGGNPNTDKLCWRCRRIKPKTEFFQRKTGRYAGSCLSECIVCTKELLAAAMKKRRLARGGKCGCAK